MNTLGKIRRLFYRDRVPVSEIARRTGYSRNTVKRWLKAPEGVEPKYRRHTTTPRLHPMRNNSLGFPRWLNPYLRNMDLDAIDEDVLKELINAKLEAGLKPSSVNRMTEMVRSILRRAQLVWKWTDRLPVFLRYVFTYLRRGYNRQPAPISGKLSTQAWHKALARAGIVDFRWHDLRHTWASWHVQRGTPLRVLMELGGWSSLDMVQRYLHLSADHLRPYVERGTKLTHGGDQKKEGRQSIAVST